MAKGIHTEATFEAAIEEYLIESGYEQGDSDHYHPKTAMVPTVLFAFLQDTQPKRWEKLSKIHGSKTKEKFLQRLVKELDSRGMLDVLRYGVTD